MSYNLTNDVTLNRVRYRLQQLLSNKANINHTHDRVNGFKIVKSSTVPTTTDNTIITLYEPESNSSNNVAASRILSSIKRVSSRSLNVDNYEDELTLDSEIYIPFGVVVEDEVESQDLEVSEVEKRMQEDPFDKEFIESLLIDGPEVTIDDLNLVVYWSIKDTLSTGQEYGDYNLSVSTFYKDEEGNFKIPEGVEYQIENLNGDIIHSKTQASSFNQILRPCTKIAIRVFFDEEDSVSDYVVPDIPFPIVSLRKDYEVVTSYTGNISTSYSSLSWNVYRQDLDKLSILLKTPDKYSSNIYTSISVYRILNVEDVLSKTYNSVSSMLEKLELDNKGMYKSIYSTSDGDSVFEIPYEYITREDSDIYYLINMTTVDGTSLNLITELHII